MATDKVDGVAAAGMGTKHATTLDSNNSEGPESAVDKVEVYSRPIVTGSMLFCKSPGFSCVIQRLYSHKPQTRTDDARLDSYRRKRSSNNLQKRSTKR
jgi:hypothetical protein